MDIKVKFERLKKLKSDYSLTSRQAKIWIDLSDKIYPVITDLVETLSNVFACIAETFISVFSTLANTISSAISCVNEFEFTTNTPA